jgi:hypothetical protein
VAAAAWAGCTKKFRIGELRIQNFCQAAARGEQLRAVRLLRNVDHDAREAELAQEGAGDVAPASAALRAVDDDGAVEWKFHPCARIQFVDEDVDGTGTMSGLDQIALANIQERQFAPRLEFAELSVADLIEFGSMPSVDDPRSMGGLLGDA